MDAMNTFYVYDQEYLLRSTGEGGTARLASATELVDRKMKEIAEQMKENAAQQGNLNAKNVAVLAALNLADDYIEIQERFLPARGSAAQAFADYDARLPAYIEKIEAFLETKEH